MTKLARFRGFAALLGLATVASTISPSFSAQPANAEHLKVDLISDTMAVTPGKSFLIGLYFEPDTAWHIYWINPGDSGEPPRVTWNLPNGFQAGPIRWPAPMRLGSGTVIDYGYIGPVLLPIEVRAPGDVKTGANVALSATVRWLVCRDICVSGKADLVLSLPVQETPAQPSSSSGLFRAALDRLPKAAPSGWKAEAASEKDNFVLTVRTGTAISKAAFFPLDADQIENSAPQVLSLFPGGVRLTLKKSDRLMKTPQILRGVLEFGPSGAYELSASVEPAP